MPFIKGYKFNTKSEAIIAQNNADIFYGIPKYHEDITTHWLSYNFAELNMPQFYYITFDESLISILGQPIEFEIIQPPFKMP